MISQEEDEYGADNGISDNRKPAPMENLAQTKTGLGETEDEAICLSDDEDNTSSNRKESAKAASSQQRQISVTSGAEGFNHRKSRVLHKYRFYNQYFEGSSYGIQLLLIGNRLAVASNRFGNAKPALGDILVAVNGYRLPLECRLEDACRYMKHLLTQGTVELTFVEDEAFIKNCTSHIIESRIGHEASGNQRNNKKPRSVTSKSEAVIEILDDD